ncbi:7494_t:CDS:2 [Scutellospora calospora]|uniref:7494_t:CDS:1 n=1 Tax=Scutellospora calospora TaxID=85575 RepID=A0ACA9K548_9GLOM|nr:7494_t:CDS:2 [Scutellospora calospora]
MNDQNLNSDLGTNLNQENNVSINNSTKKVYQGDYKPELCLVPKALNAIIHPTVVSFFDLGNDRIINRYSNLNPQVDVNILRQCLEYESKFYKWAASDFFNVVDSNGKRQMILVESGSCPAGQTSMPLLNMDKKRSGYRLVIQTALKRALKDADPSLGGLAVVYDEESGEIPVEPIGYAAAISEETNEHIWLVKFLDDTRYEQPVKWENQVMYIRDQDGAWHSIRACFIYMAQKPWSYFPLKSKTIVVNNVISCLAGGQNKIMATKSYELFNNELSGSGLSIRFPETVCNVNKREALSYIEKMGGHAVIKAPYGTAGKGIYIITNSDELKEFLDDKHQHYEKFLVQSLVENASWFPVLQPEKYYHIGTMPNCSKQTFVYDLRMMVSSDETGFHPVLVVSRRARKPLPTHLSNNSNYTLWEIFGTNVSVKTDSEWVEESDRVIMMDQKGFEILGLGIDDLIDAYVQTVLSVIAIDKMSIMDFKALVRSYN